MRTLEEIYEDIRNDDAFQYLRLGKNRLVPGEGDYTSPRAFILGEAPGAEEAMSLRPFVGKAGKLLRELMALAGLSADNRLVWRHRTDVDGTHNEPNVWLTNVIKYRPIRNRNPARNEMVASRIYILEEWQSVHKPPVIVCVGRIAAQTIGRSTMERAKPYVGKQEGTWVWHMWHTSYVLRHINDLKVRQGEEIAQAFREEVEDHWHTLGEWLRANAL